MTKDDPSALITPAEAARISPTASFDSPDDVVKADDLTKKEKVKILDQWEADAIALETATDEGMSGGNDPELDAVNKAQTEVAGGQACGTG